MKKYLFSYQFFLLFVSLFLPEITQAQILSAQNGDWNDPATWIGSIVPGAADNVEISHEVDIKDFDMQVNDLTIKSGGKLLDTDNTGTNTIHGALSVEVGGEFTPAYSEFRFGGNITNEGVFVMGSNTLATTKSPPPISITITANQTITFDSFEFYSNITYAGIQSIIFKDDYYTGSLNSVVQNNPTIIFEGFDVRFNGTFTPNTGKVIFQGNINQEVAGDSPSVGFYDLEINKTGGTFTSILSEVNILHDFTINDDIAIGTFSLGDFSSNTPGTLNYSTGAKVIGTLELIVNTTGTYTFPVASSLSVDNPLTVNLTGSPLFTTPSSISVGAFPNTILNEAGMVNPAIATGMYWDINASNITTANFTITGRYSDIQGTEASYVGGYRVPASSFWRTAGSSVNIATDEVTFTFTGVDASDISGFYAAGEPLAFLPSITVAAPSAIQPPSATLFANTINNPIYKIRIDVTGAPVTLDEVHLTTSGSYTSSDITQFQLFRTSSPSFNSSDPVGSSITSTSTGTGETLNFTGLTKNLSIGTHYVWLTANVSLSPTGSHTVSVNTFTASSDLVFVEAIDLTAGTINSGNIFNFSTTIGLFYSNDISTDFTNTSGWGANLDGTGPTPNPSDFTSGNVSFFINSGHTKDVSSSSIIIRNLIVEGILLDNVPPGTNQFLGLVEVRGGAGNFNVTTAVTFYSSVVNNNLFTANNAVLDGGPDGTLLANTAMIFNGLTTFNANRVLHGEGGFTFNEVTLGDNIDVTNFSNVTIDNALTGFDGNEKWINGENSVLHFRKLDDGGGDDEPMHNGILDASAPNNTVYYDENGNQLVASATYHHLVLDSYGDKGLDGAIFIKGDFTNNATFVHNNYTVTFNGTANPQSITGATTFYDVDINNTNPTVADRRVTLASPITVSNTLALISGRVVLGVNNLTLTNTTVASQLTGAPFANSWIETNDTGRLFRQGSTTGTFHFPVGTATELHNITLSEIAVSAGVGFVSPNTPDFYGSGTPARQIVGMWEITQTGGTTATTITLKDVRPPLNTTDRIHRRIGVSAGDWADFVTTYPSSDLSTTYNFTAAVTERFAAFTPPPLTFYSRKTGDWNDVTAGDGMWSTVSHTGPSCDCVPTSGGDVFIAEDHVVTIPTGYTALAQHVTLQDKDTGSSGGTLIVTGTGALHASTLTIGNEAVFFANNTVDNLVGTVNGTSVPGGWGTLRSSKPNPFQVAPGGTFMTNSLNVVEYTGGSYLLNAGYITTYPSLLITATGLIFANENVSVTGDFTLNTPSNTDVVSLNTTSSNHVLTIQGNLVLREGILELGRMGITVDGTTTIENGATLRDNFDDSAFPPNYDLHTFNGIFEVQTGGAFTTGGSVNSFNHFSDDITNSGTFNLIGSARYTFQKTGGTLIVTPNANMVFASPNSGQGFVNCDVTIADGNGNVQLNSNTGSPLTVSATRTLTNQNGGTGFLRVSDMLSGAGTFVNAANAYLVFMGSAMPDISNFIVNSAGNTVSYSRSGAQTIRGGAYHHIVLGGTGIKTLDTDVQVAGDFTVSVATFDHNNRTVIFNGSANAQTITGTTTFYDLDINNTNPTVADRQVTLASPITVSNTLALISGRVVLGANNLTLTNPTVATQLAGTPFTNSWVETNGTGLLQRNGSGTGVEFPVGDNSEPRTVIFNTVFGTNLVRFTTTIAPAVSAPNVAAGMWIINTPAGTSPITLRNVGTGPITSSTIYQSNGAAGWIPVPTSPPTLPDFSSSGIVSLGADQRFTVFSAQTLYARANGNWNTGTTWSTVSSSDIGNCGCTPISGDEIVIENGWTVTLTANNQLDNMRLILGTTNGSGTLNIGTTTHGTVASITTTATSAAQAGRLIISAPNLGTAVFPTFAVNSFTTNAYAIVEYNTVNNYDIPGMVYPNLVISGGGGTKTLAGNANPEGNLTVTSGTTFNPSSFNLFVDGITTIDGTFLDNAAGGDNVFQQLVTVSNTGSWNTTAVAAAANMVFRDGITNNGTFNAGAATFEAGAQAISGTNPLIFNADVELISSVILTNNTDVTLQAGGNLSPGTQWIQAASTSAVLRMGGNWTGTGTLNAAGTGNQVRYYGASTQVKAATYYDIFIQGTITKTLAGAITCHDLSIEATANNKLSSGGFQIDFTGNFTVGTNAEFIPASGVVRAIGGSPQNVTFNGTGSFHNFELAKTSTALVTIQDNLVVDNDLSFPNNGVLRVSNGTTLTVSGSTTLTGTGTNILEMEGTASFVGSSPTYNAGKILRYINPNNTTKTIGNEWPVTMNGNVEINLLGAAAALNLTGASTITGNLTITDGRLNLSNTLSLAAIGTHTLAASAELEVQSGGNLTVQNGATLTNNTTNLNVLSSGIVTCEGTGSIVNNSPTYAAGSALHYTQANNKTVGLEFPATMNGDIVINKLSNTELITLNADKTLNGNLTLTTGKLVLDDYTLTLGTNSSISGADNNKFVVASMNGKLIKNFALSGSPGTFDFPVGGALYSPLSLSYTAITTAGSLEVGLKEVDNPNVITVNRSLKRYWQLASTGGLAFTGTGLTFNYRDPDDIDGSEASYVTARFTSGNWITSEGTVDPTLNFFTQPFISNQIPNGEYTAGELIAFVSPAVVGIATSNAIDLTAEPSETNHVVYQIRLDVSVAAATLTGLALTTSGTYATGDLANFKLYLSTDTDWDVSDVPLGSPATATSAGETISFSSLSQNLAIGTHYLLVTADVTASPVAGRTFGMNAFTLPDITFVSATKNNTGITASTLHVVVPTGGVTMPLGNRGMYFDGVDDYVSLGNTADFRFENTLPYTISAWVKPQNKGSNVTVISRWNNGVGVAWGVILTTDGRLRVYRNITPFFTDTAPNLVPFNKWTHIAMTYDGSTLRAFVNGVQEASVTIGSIGTHNVETIIGGRFNASVLETAAMYQGQIDEVRIFNTARTAAQIQFDMATTTPNGAVGYWNFNESTGTTANDLGSGGNNGTLTNTPFWALRVTNTSDNIADVGSLRWAVAEANSDAATDTDYIDFSINNVTPTTHTITLGSTLTATESIFIDGYSALGSSMNTATVGTNATLRINVTGAVLTDGLVLNGSGSVVRGLAVYGSIDNKVVLGGTGSHRIQGCFIGTDDAATTAFGGQNGIVISAGSANNLVGGTNLANRNLISGNAQEGLRLGGDANEVYGNYFGTRKDGSTALANGFSAVLITTGNSNTIGGLGVGQANVMTTGLRAVFVQTSGQNNSIRGNRMFGHSALSIDLAPINRTLNDTGAGTEDDDAGANRLQNFPILNLAQVNAGDLTVDFNVPSRYVASPTGGQSRYPLTIDFYKSDGGGDAEIYLGTLIYSDAQALTNVNATFTPLATVAVGDRIVASATDADGNTSEISDEIVVTGIPNLTFTTDPVIAAGNIMQGQTNRVLYAARIENDATATAVLQAVRFYTTNVGAENTFTASDITNFRAYVSNDNTWDIGDTQLGGVVSGISGANAAIVFTGANIPYNIPVSSTRYLFLVADVNAGATIGRTITIAAPSFGTGSQDLVFLTGNFSGTLSAGGTQTIVPSEPSQPTSLTFSNITHNNLELSFVSSGATGYLILRRLGSAVADAPTDFVTYTVGDDIGSSTVAYIGDATTLPINDGGLNTASEYHYAIFAYNGTGPLTNYNTTSPLSGSRWTLSVPPTGHSATFTAVAVSTSQIDLTFNAASSVGANGYLLLRRDDDTAPDATGFINGTEPSLLIFPLGTSLVANITNPAQTTYADASLSPGIRYDYALIPYTWDGTNTTTYHYYIVPAIPTTFAITLGTSTTVLTFNYSEDISSTIVAASGSDVFSFNVIDDDGSGGDGLPTQISQVVISQSGTNDPAFANWTTLIAGAQLTDGTNTIAGTIGTNTITFSGIPIGFGQLGRVEDDATKSYTVRIWLNSNLGSLAGIADNKKIGFRVTESSFTLSGATSYFASSQLAQGESTVQVDAIQARFIVQPPATAVVSAIVSPTIIVWATDAYGNRDLDYTRPATVTNAGSLSMSGVPAEFIAGQMVFGSLVYNDTGDGTLTVASPPLTSATSMPVTVGGLPSVSVSNTSLAYTENQPAVTVLQGLGITNPLSGLNYALLEFTSGYVAGQDRFVWMNTPNFTTSWNETIGQLLVTSGLPTSEFVSFLSNVGYVNESENPVAGNRTVRFHVRNNAGNSNDVFITIAVTPVNDAPVLIPMPNLVLINVVEDGAPVIIGADSLVRATQESIDAEGSLYGVGISYADTAAGYWAYSLNGGTTWTDFGGVVSNTNALLLRNIPTTKIRFTPKPGVNGLFQHLWYRLWDGTDGAAEGSFVSMAVNGGSSPFSSDVQQGYVSILAVNDPPSFTLSQTNLYLDEDAPLLTITNFAQDIDDGDAELTQQLQFVLQPVLLQGNLTFSTLSIDANTGTLQLQPSPNRYGRVMVVVRLYDDGLNGGLDRNVSDDAIFYVHVRPINDAPVLAELVGATHTLRENQSHTWTVSDLLDVLYAYNDADGDTLGLAIVGVDNTYGSWEYSQNGTDWQDVLGATMQAAWHVDKNDLLRFVPRTGWNGEISEALRYKLWDRTNGLTGGTVADASFVSDTLAYSLDVQRLRLVVEAVNGAPTFAVAQDTIRILEDTGLVEIANFVFDVEDGDEELTESVVFYISPAGNLTYAQNPTIDERGTLRFEVAENENGEDTWAVWAEDEGGAVSDTVYVTLLVESVNDVPAFVLSADSLILGENFVGEVVVEATLLAVPADELAEEIRFSLLPTPQEISFMQVRFDTLTGRIVLRSLPNRFGAVWLVVTADDGRDTYSDSVYVRVLGESFAPTDIVLSNTVLIGNPAIGYKVGVFEVEDADELDEHFLSLVAGYGDTDNNKFEIVGDELRTKVRLDYKEQSRFSIRVRAEDEVGEFIEKMFELTMLPPTLSPEDSLALAELNEFLKDKLPWSSNLPIYEWQGVRIEENRLVGLDLSGFSLDTMSVEILRKLDDLEELDLSGNALDFHDLLPIVELGIDSLTYSPQKEIGERRELFIALQSDGENITLHAIPMQPAGSQYQWLRNEEVLVDRNGKIEGSQQGSLTIREVEEEDGGVFVCEVVHPSLPGLKLRTQPLILNLHQFLLLQDSLALIAIRELFPSRVGGRSEDWTEGYASTWKGVRVRRNRVIGLDLSGRQMKGAFPKEVGNLTALRRLNLFDNDLTQLPKEMGEMKQLEFLDLDGNDLKEIPAEIFTLDKINTLWLARNQLDTLPAGIERMTGLRNLFLQENRLKELPSGLRQLDKLEILDVSRNELSGDVNLVGLNGVKVVRMSENSINSVIVFGLRNLEEINLENNELREFPFSRAEHPTLARVSVRWNRLTFEDLEEAVLVDWNLGYVPQKRFSADEERKVEAGSLVELFFSVGGTANQYSWYKDGVRLDEQTTHRLVLSNVAVDNAGIYELRATSSKVPGLEVVSGQLRLVVGCGANLSLESLEGLQFCSNVSVSSRLRVRGGDASWNYRWYRDGVEQLLMRGVEVTATLPGTYEVRVRDNNGCERISNTLRIEVIRSPEVRIREVAEFVLEAEGEGEGEYQWYRDGVLIEGAKDKRYEIEKRGTYWVKFVSKATGCEAYSEAKKFSVTGLSEEELVAAIELYPNPTRDEVTLHFGDVIVGNVDVELINMNGVVLKEWELNTLDSRSKHMNVSDLPSGVYVLRIHHESIVLIKRLTKQ